MEQRVEEKVRLNGYISKNCNTVLNSYTFWHELTKIIDGILIPLIDSSTVSIKCITDELILPVYYFGIF